MPWLPLYIDQSDLAILSNWLNEEEDIAFIVGNGPKKWKAVNSIEECTDGRHCLWHCASGPLPLLRKWGLPEGRIQDPFKGWKERRAGADPRVPCFGAGHPGVYWLNVHTESPHEFGSIGLSSFEWIGNRYKAIGIGAHPSAKKWWERLRRWVKKQAVKIPRTGPWDGDGAEIYAFPSALDKIRSGDKRDDNPWGGQSAGAE